MIGHNHIFFNIDTRNLISAEDIPVHNFACLSQPALRGVEGAAPYDSAKKVFAIFNTYGDKIGAGVL